MRSHRHLLDGHRSAAGSNIATIVVPMNQVPKTRTSSSNISSRDRLQRGGLEAKEHNGNSDRGNHAVGENGIQFRPSVNDCSPTLKFCLHLMCPNYLQPKILLVLVVQRSQHHIPTPTDLRQRCSHHRCVREMTQMMRAACRPYADRCR